jgi:hypothetical protein
MSDLETKLAKAYEEVIDDYVENGIDSDTVKDAFDAAAAIAREAIAEKDAEIAQLKAELRIAKGDF